MKKTWSIFYGLLLATFLKSTLALPTHIESAAKEERSHLSKDGCPNYRYKCPDCPHGTQCVYPNSGGCDGAGIPVCQSLNCHGIVCLLRSLPCPEECPFSCTYDGPGCCPFIGEPVCKPRCETFAPCKETPCPDDCHDDCFYPDADYCCPRSGQPVCRNRGRRLDSFAALPDKNDILSASSSNVQISPSSSVPAASPSDYIPSQVPKVDKRQAEEPSPVLSYARLDESRWFDQPIGPQMPESASWFLQDVPGKVVSTLGTPTRSAPPELYLPNATPTPYGSNWFYQPSGPLVPPSPSSWLYQPTPKEGCPPCPPLPTPTWGICTVHHDDRECCPYITCVDVPLSVNRPSDATASHAAASNADAALDPTEHVNVCANHNNPCPKKCPDSCNHPKNVPCPLQHQPASPPLMPVVVTVTVTASRIKHTPAPPAALPTKKHIPALDRPLESVSKILSSLRHVQLPTGASRPDVNDAVLPTGVARHQAVGHNPEPVACPKIIYQCPPECPDYCIRPRGPCPYAVVPVCPDGEDEDEPRYMDDADLYIDSLEPHPIHKNP